MTYSNEIEILPLATSPTTVQIRIWEGHSVIDGSDQIRWQDSVVETVSRPYATTVPFTTNTGPTAVVTPLYSIGFSVHFGSAPGPLFRSGYVEALAPGRPVDPQNYVSILEAPVTIVSQAQLDSALAAPPPAGLGPPPFTMPKDPTTTVMSLGVMIGSGTLDVTAAGVTTRFLGIPVAFSYAGQFTLEASTSMYPDTTTVLGSGFTNPGTITFGPAGPSPFSPGAAAFLNLISGLVVGSVATSIRQAISDSANTAALTAAASALGGGAAAPATLPPGVVLSISRVVVGTVGGVTGIHVIPALGCFGSLKDRLFPAGTPPIACPLSRMADESSTSPEEELTPFRRVRDRMLADPAAALWVQRYYRHAPELIELLAADDRLAGRATAVMLQLGMSIGRGNAVTEEEAKSVAELARRLASQASPGLQAVLNEVAVTAGRDPQSLPASRNNQPRAHPQHGAGQ